MMPALPNILPAAKNDPLNGGGEMIFPGAAQKNGEAFDHLMSRALSPASNEANPPEKNAAENFLARPKNSAASAPASGKDRAKTTRGNLESGKNSPAPPETNAAALQPENILMQIVAPVLPPAEIPVAGSKTAAGKSAEIFTALPEVKKQSQPETKTIPAVTTAGQGKITAAVEALSAQKTNSTDLKIGGLTPANPPALPLAKEVAGDLTPKPADKLAVPAVPAEFSAPPDLKEKVAAPTAPEVNGTSVAQQDAPMNKMEKPNKTASSNGKILPGAVVSAARENNLPARETVSATVLARAGQVAANATANSSASNGMTEAATSPAGAANSLAGANVAEVRSRALERVQDMVVLHADRLSESGNASLQVVLKPGAGTQLSLELRQRGDGVEAQAVLQRGDFEHLNQQWPALQQQLEQRGIRLAPLVSGENFVGTGENNFQPKQNQSAEPDAFSTFAEVAPAGSFAPTPASAGTHRGWESWA